MAEESEGIIKSRENFKVIERIGDIVFAEAKYLGGPTVCSNHHCKKPIHYGDTVVMVIDRINNQILAIFEDVYCKKSLEMEFIVTGRKLNYAMFPQN